MAEIKGLTDVTAKTFSTLTNPPDGTAIMPQEASAWCLKDTKTCVADTKDRVNDKPFYARNKDWDPVALPKLSSPLRWPFLKHWMFTADVGGDIFDLDLVDEPNAEFSIKIFEIGYTRSPDFLPDFVAVAIPKGIDKTKPPPFLVNVKHIPGQFQLKAGKKPTPEEKKALSLFRYFRPLGYDWLAYEIWCWLVYATKDNRPQGGKLLVDAPFISIAQRSFGFAYQLQQAKKNYVLVLPQIAREHEQNGKLKNFRLYEAPVLRELLLRIQKELFGGGDQISHVAISANSSGCGILSDFLAHNMARMKDPATAAFMQEELNEIFIFDTEDNIVDALITKLAPWMGLSSSRAGFMGKSLRLYGHHYVKNMQPLTGTTKNPFTKGTNGIWDSTARPITVAYLPFDTTGRNDVWQRTQGAAFSSVPINPSTFDFVHHAIPALCLTHAAQRSLYV